jgi:hypothetical protein
MSTSRSSAADQEKRMDPLGDVRGCLTQHNGLRPYVVEAGDGRLARRLVPE